MSEITIRISSRTLRIALFVTMAIFLAWSTSHLWSSGLLRPKYELHVFVPEANGILAGSSVTLEGIPVGSVSSVSLATKAPDPNRRLDITLKIQRRFQNLIREDSAAALLTQGLLGNRFVQIHRGFSAQSLPPGGEIRFVPTTELKLADFESTVSKIANCVNQGEASETKNSSANSNKVTAHQ